MIVFSFYLSRECQLSTMLFSHPATHSHTWELPTVIKILSCTAMCSFRRAVGASLTCLDFIGKDTESVTATLSFSQKSLRDLNWQPSSHKTVSTGYFRAIYHETLPMFTKKLLREIKCHFCDKITQGKQIYSSATAKDAKVMFFSPIRHS